MSDLSLTHPAPRPPKAGRFRAPTDEAPAARRALILVSVLGLAVLVLAPLVTVFAEALARGVGPALASLADPQAWPAIRLTLIVAAIAVPLNALFGLAAAWAITKFDFRGKAVFITPIDLPFAVSPVVVGVALILRASGSVAAFLTGTDQPAAGPASGISVLFRPGDPAAALDAPGMSAVAYWAVTVVLLAGLVAGGCWVWTRLRRHARKTEVDPHTTAGVATRHEVATVASPTALLTRAGNLRPSLSKPTPADVGYRLGMCRGREVWASVEDSILLIGPPRSGKGLHVVIPAILDAPGAVIATSTRPDNLTATLRAREKHGPVAVFDPQHLAEGVPAGMRWSPVRGCADPLTAMIRATGLASATGLSAGGVESGGFWEGKTRTALQALLHAAALDGRSPAELFRWTLDPSIAAEAVAVLTNHPGAATGWADSLGAMIDSDPKTRDSIWQGVSLALGALADPRVLDAVTPRAGHAAA